VAEKKSRKFDMTVYRKGALRQALEAFRDFADLRAATRPGGYVEVTVRQCPAAYRDSILDEFANYVLGATWKLS